MNLLQSFQNVRNLFRQNLVQLKQLYQSKASLRVFQQTIWSFNRKLPIEYQQAVLQFSSSEYQSKSPNSSMPQRALKLFTQFDYNAGIQKRIHQIQFFVQEQKQMFVQQLSVIKYNLACLYQILNKNTKAINIVSDCSSTSYTKKLKQKIILKLRKQQNNLCQEKKSQQSLISRFLKIKSVCTLDQLFQYISSFNSCQGYEIYNIGICLKKLKRYGTASQIFQWMSSEISKQKKDWVLCQINISQCYFNMSMANQAIKVLRKLVESQNFYITPFAMELEFKIQFWSKSNQILQLSSKLKNCKINNQGSKFYESKTILKNRKLLLVEQKQKQLQKIKQKLNCVLPSSSRKKGHKICYSHVQYQAKHNRKFSSITSRHFLQSKNTAKLHESIKKINQKIQNTTEIKPKMKMKKNSQNIQIQSFLNLFQNSLKGSNKSISSSFSRKSHKYTDQNLIDHYLTIIKNSQDESQIAEKYLNLGDTYVEDKDLQKASDAYRKALQNGRLEAYGRLGNLYYSKGKMNIAYQYFQKYLKHVDENDHQIQMKLLHCYSKNPEFYKKTMEILNKILAENPYDTEAHILKAVILMKQKYYDKAIQICQKFKQVNFMCYENQHLLGLLYKGIERYKQAYQSFIYALRVSPNSISSLIQITQMSQTSHFLPELIQIYRKALHTNFKNHQIYQILYCLVSNKSIIFQQISSVLSFCELVKIGDFFIDKQMIQEAQFAYKQASQYTNNTLLKQKLGNLQYKRKNYDLAEKYYIESQKRKPNFKIQIKIADSLIKQNKFVQALQLLQQRLQKQNQSKSICLNMIGQCQYGLKNYEKALQNFQKSSYFGYNKKINFTWEKACRKMIMQKLKNTEF